MRVPLRSQMPVDGVPSPPPPARPAGASSLPRQSARMIGPQGGVPADRAASGGLGDPGGPRILLESPKKLYRLFERVFAAADDRHGGKRLLAWCLREFHDTFRVELGLRAAWLYSGNQGRFHLVAQVGEPLRPAPAALEASDPEVRALLAQASQAGGEIVESGSAFRLGLTPDPAAVGMLVSEPRARHLLFVSFDDRFEPDAACFVLRTLRSVLSARILQNRWGNALREAAEIQRGLLPATPPEFGPFEIAARSVPAEDVGGDLYDFLPIDEYALGLAIADASGHGLGAALVARDVCVGLRMGARRETKLTHALAQLNRVVHRSSPGGSFVSAFYAELDPQGNLMYANAGHPPPLMVTVGGVRTLQPGNSVLGPLPDTRFQRHFDRIDPGSALVLYTDGISERRNADGAFFEPARLGRIAQEHLGRPAAEILDRIFRAAQAFGSDQPWDDDATVVVVRRRR